MRWVVAGYYEALRNLFADSRVAESAVARCIVASHIVA